MPDLLRLLGVEDKVKEIQEYEEIFKIWREYLSRSNLYKKGCDWVQTLGYNPARKFDPEYIDRAGGIKCREVIGEFINLVDQRFIVDDTAADYAVQETIKLMLQAYYPFFGDVHSEPFDEFWSRASCILMELSLFDDLRLRTTPSVVPLEEAMAKARFSLIKECFVAANNREPTVDELIQHASKWDNDVGTLTAHILLTRPLADIVADLKHLIKQTKQRRQIPIQKSYYNYCLPTQPAKNIDVKAHKRYIEVYDLKTLGEKTWKEVILHFHPDMDPTMSPDWDSTERMYKADLSKARKVLANIENGQFPGIIT